MNDQITLINILIVRGDFLFTVGLAFLDGWMVGWLDGWMVGWLVGFSYNLKLI